LKILDIRLQISDWKERTRKYEILDLRFKKITFHKRQKLFCSMVQMETLLTTNDMRIFPMHLFRIYISLILWEIKLSTSVESFYEETGILLKIIPSSWFLVPSFKLDVSGEKRVFKFSSPSFEKEGDEKNG
jgi:hypothetical protein